MFLCGKINECKKRTLMKVFSYLNPNFIYHAHRSIKPNNQIYNKE